MVLSGYNSTKNKTMLYLFALITNEKENTFSTLFSYLKEKFSFNPHNYMCNFALGQINALKKVFPDVQLHCCFFHFSQAIWNNFKKNDLCGIGTYEKNSELLFNIQILCFIKRDKIEKFFKEIIKKYKERKYKIFLNYFNKTWLGTRYPTNIWNFNDIISGDENKVKNFHFTNNLSENINRYLNNNLKRGICSNFLFRKSILTLIDQFESKSSNSIIDKKKSDILSFYIKNTREPKILCADEEKNYILYIMILTLLILIKTILKSMMVKLMLFITSLKKILINIYYLYNQIILL